MPFFYPLKISLMLFSILLIPFSAQAALVSTSLEGTVTFDNGGNNPFGLSNGNSVFASATYDDSLVLGNSPDEEIFIDGLAGWNFTITLGTFSFSQTDVTDPTWTSFYFDNGRLDGINFYIEPIDIGNFANILLEDFNGGRSLFAEDATNHNPVYLELDWDFVNATPPAPATVPLPAAFWLFFSGFMGLFGIGRQRNKSLSAG